MPSSSERFSPESFWRNYFDSRVDFFDILQQRSWYTATLQEFLDFTAPHRDWLVLDVGCGPGNLTLEIARRCGFAVGVDFSEPMIQRARLKASALNIKNTMFKTGNLPRLPFNSNSFDLVIASSIIHVLQNPIQGIQEMMRTAKSGAAFAALTLNFHIDPPKALSLMRNAGVTNILASKDAAGNAVFWKGSIP